MYFIHSLAFPPPPPQRAVSCSANFPVVDHIINAEIPESVITVLTNEITDTITVTLGPPASTIMADTVYTISVTAATAITSRASDVFQVCESDELFFV